MNVPLLRCVVMRSHPAIPSVGVAYATSRPWAQPLRAPRVPSSCLSRVRHTVVAGALLWPTLMCAAPLPDNPRVTSGTVVITNPADGGRTLDLVQSSPTAVVHWDSFSVARDARVDITQPTPHAILLNRVTGDAASMLEGALRADGVVWLINPNGIMIDSTGTVDAGGFLASTLDIADAALPLLPRSADHQSLAHSFLAQADLTRTGPPGVLLHRGAIRAGEGQQVALVAGAVVATGSIHVDAGQISVLGYGTHTDNDAVNVTGTLRARCTTRGAGRIAIDGLTGNVRLSDGVVDASGPEGIGGSVLLNGGRIDVEASTIDVSGAMRGGEVALLARSFPGAAQPSIALSRDVRVLANAVTEGAGGVIHILSTGTTSSAARIDASAASIADPVLWRPIHASAAIRPAPRAIAGHGGRIELSGDQGLTVSGDLDAHASRGAARGHIALNGPQMRIVAMAPVPAAAPDGGVGSGMDVGPAAASPQGVIDARTLSRALHRNDVTVRANDHPQTYAAGKLDVASPLQWAGDTALTLQANGGLAIRAPVVALGAAPALHLRGGKASSCVSGAGRIELRGLRSSLHIDDHAYTLIRDPLTLVTLLRRPAGGRYALANDIDLGNRLAEPTAGPAGGYFIHLDGLGNTIRNLTIDAPNRAEVGLFPSLDNGARVSNLGLVNARVTGGRKVGALVGRLDGGSVLTDVHVADAVVNAVSAQGNGGTAGGIAGLVRNGSSITRSTVQAAVSGHSEVGAVAGSVAASRIVAVTSGGQVNGHHHVGGMVGTLDESTLEHSAWSGDVRGVGEQARSIGGLVGQQRDAGIVASSANGTVQGALDTGGLAGNISGQSVVDDCAATVAVTGGDSAGGLAGYVGEGAVLLANVAHGEVHAAREVGQMVGHLGRAVLYRNASSNLATGMSVPVAGPVGRLQTRRNALLVENHRIAAAAASVTVVPRVAAAEAEAEAEASTAPMTAAASTAPTVPMPATATALAASLPPTLFSPRPVPPRLFSPRPVPPTLFSPPPVPPRLPMALELAWPASVADSRDSRMTLDVPARSPNPAPPFILASPPAQSGGAALPEESGHCLMHPSGVLLSGYRSDYWPTPSPSPPLPFAATSRASRPLSNSPAELSSPAEIVAGLSAPSAPSAPSASPSSPSSIAMPIAEPPATPIAVFTRPAPRPRALLRVRIPD